MKKWLIGASVLVVALAALVSVLMNRKKPDTDVIDGGVQHHVDTDAPKIIVSTQITCFHCVFSTTNIMMDDSPIAGRIMTLHAEGENGYLDLRGREREVFSPDEGFYQQLQQIVTGYDFAQYNGQFYTVSGLPPDIGMKLEIRYASGETICASNNQSCFLPLEALEALAALFEKQTTGGI